MPNVACPSCGRSLRLAEGLHGAPVQCPRCGTTFTGPGEAAETLAPAEGDRPWLDNADEPLGLPVPLREVPPPPPPLRPVLLGASSDPEATQACPVCGSREPPGRRECSLCGAALSADRPPRRDYEPDRGPVIFVLGTLSVLFGLPGLCGALYWPFLFASIVGTGLGVSALVMAAVDLERMEQDLVDPEGRGSTRAGRNQAAVGTGIGLIGVLLGGLVFVSKAL
jgi:hypothetical protein